MSKPIAWLTNRGLCTPGGTMNWLRSSGRSTRPPSEIVTSNGEYTATRPAKIASSIDTVLPAAIVIVRRTDPASLFSATSCLPGLTSVSSSGVVPRGLPSTVTCAPGGVVVTLSVPIGFRGAAGAGSGLRSGTAFARAFMFDKALIAYGAIAAAAPISAAAAAIRGAQRLIGSPSAGIFLTRRGAGGGAGVTAGGGGASNATCGSNLTSRSNSTCGSNVKRAGAMSAFTRGGGGGGGGGWGRLRLEPELERLIRCWRFHRPRQRPIRPLCAPRVGPAGCRFSCSDEVVVGLRLDRHPPKTIINSFRSRRDDQSAHQAPSEPFHR